jgi:hypothetical protein
MSRSLAAAALVTHLFLSSLPAADKDGVTDPAKADADFPFQGEYVGIVKTGEGDQKIGAQVIALGEGKFQIQGHIGGLPGDGWDKSERKPAEGQRDGNLVKIANEQANITIKEGAIIIVHDGIPCGELLKAERASPTLNARPPVGSIVLFDGTTAEHFNGGKLTEDGLLMPGVTSKRQFEDFTLHLEFKLPYMPAARGQARGNSGCYLQGRYEVQILDSFGLEGKNNECGGIYEIKDPDVNMCLPPLAWQTYDIDYTAARYDSAGAKTANARITVRHNGVVVQDNVELPRATRAAPVKEGPEPGPVYLQDHGNPVRFRNIWVVEKKS